MKKSLRLLFIGMCLVPMATRGQMLTDSLSEVTVTGTRPSGDLLFSTPIHSIRQADIQLLGLHDLADAVKKLAGVSVKDYGGIGGLKTVSVRNLGAHHTAVSYDGICISNTQAGQIDIGRYTLDNVNEVRMAIGQDDDLMSSARHAASAGILSITTEQQPVGQQPTSLRIGLTAGSFGLLTPTLRVWHRIGNRTRLSADGAFTRVDGCYPFTLINGRQRTRERRNNGDINAWRGEANVSHTFRDSSEVAAKVYYYYSERGLPGGIILYNMKGHERLWDENFFTQATYHRQIARQWQLYARVKYNHSWNRYDDVNVKYAGGKQTDIARQNEYYASATVGWQPATGLSVALAEDIAYNDLRSNIESQPNPHRITSLTSLTTRYKGQRLTVNGNLVATYMTEDSDQGRHPADRKRLSPSLSASWRLLPRESLFLRAMVKSTFRVPTFTDMYYLHIGNSNLVPEKAIEYNTGLTWSRQLTRQMNIQLTIDGYYNHVSDKIVCFPTTYVWKMTNFGRVDIRGIDATVAIATPITQKVTATGMLTYSLQDAKDKSDPKRPTYGCQIPYTPHHSGNGSITVRTPWLNIGYHVNACGERWSNAQNLSEYRLKPYWEHNVTLSRQIPLRHARLSLSVTVQNLTDQQYEVIQYYPMPGRNFLATATLDMGD